MRKWMVLSLVLVLVLLTGCSSGGGSRSDAAVHILDQGEALVAQEALVPVGNAEKVGYQLEPPQKGEEIAVVTMADGSSFKLRFFPDEAPKTVYNFKKHALDGYFDGLTFHRIIQGFMIQGGDPAGTGTGGEAVWGDSFEDEFAANLLNLNGAVSMANRGANTNRSQFFINTTGDSRPNWENYQAGFEVYKTDPEAFTSQYGRWINMEKVTQEMMDLYNEVGGNAHLDGATSTTGEGHTVFAQVFEGMDVVHSLSQVAVGSDGSTPVEPVVIQSVKIVLYE